MNKPKRKWHKLEIVLGVGGKNLILNDYRIYGSLEYENGRILETIMIDDEFLKHAIKQHKMMGVTK